MSGFNFAITVNFMPLPAEDINNVRQGKDDRTQSNACLNCGRIGHFGRDCTTGLIDPVDANT